MKKLTILPVIAAALSLAAMPAAAVARTAADEAKAEFVGKVKRHGDEATLHIRYACNVGDHLWVSVKQSADGKRDDRLTQWGSSEIAAAWWQSHRNEFTCDGRRRTQKFVVDTVEPGSKGALRKGEAWVQFCLTDMETEELEIYELGWVEVR